MGICDSFTNYDTIIHPLRNENGKKYRGWLKVIYHEAVERQEKKLFKSNAAGQNESVIDLKKYTS